MATFINLSIYALLGCVLIQAIFASEPKLVIYWGQESSSAGEQPLATYCATGAYDIIVIGFAYEFPFASGSPTSAYPALNFANHCSTTYDDENPYLLICPDIAADILTCQSLGVQILMSFGGGVGRYGFDSDAQAITFATTVWDMFLGGNGAVRPFGNAILDGVDLDIEGGATTGYISFIETLRSYYATANKPYYISSAPQCVFPDGRLGPGTGTALQSAWFDYVWVQFYNNYCGIDSPTEFNWATWANWAMTTSINPNVKVFIGAPASSDAAGSGYITAAELIALAADAAISNPSVFGGIMLWDTSNSDLNNNFGPTIHNLLNIASVSVQSAPSQSPSTAPSTTAAAVSVPSTSAAPVHATTAAPVHATTAATVASAPSTTGARTLSSTPSTTGARTVSVAPSTPSTTGSAALAPTHPVSGSTTASATASASCTPGFMKCLTSETYSTCNRGVWGPSQSCQVNLNCDPAGNYIYCV